MKNLLKWVFICCLCVTVLCGAGITVYASAVTPQEGTGNEEPGDEEETPQEPEIKVLMLGNSFTKRGAKEYECCNVGNILENMAVSNDKNINVKTIMRGGSYLYYYAFWSYTYKDYYEAIMSALMTEQYDYIILQDQTRAAIEKYENVMLPAIEQLCKYISAYQTKAEVLVYETAPYVDGLTTLVDGEEKILTLQEFQERSLYGYARLQKALGLERIPAGMQTYHGTQLYPEIKMVSDDLKHPAYAGYYIAAASVYYKLFGEIPVNTSEDLKKWDIGDEQVLLLNEMVKDDIVLNKTELTLAVGESDILQGEIVAAEERKGILFWKSLHPEIATVDEVTGKITGVAEGTTVVIAETTTGLMKACLVTVENNAPLQLSFGQAHYQVSTDDVICLLPKIKNWQADDTLKWFSSNTAVAMVSADGTVRTKQMGRTVIKVKSSKNSEISATYILYVKGKSPEKLTVNVKKVTAAGGKVKLTWQPVYGAKKYQIYRYDVNTESYTVIGTSETNTYTDTTVGVNISYDYKVTAMAGSAMSESDTSEKVSVMLLGTVKNQIGNITKKYIKLTWNKNEMATGYEIYRSEKKNSGYKKIKTISKNGRLYYCDRTAEKGKTYYYKIRAYKTISGKTSYSAYSNIVKGGILGAVKNQIGAVTKKYIKLTWSKSTNATGYEIYRSEKKNNGYTKIKTISKNGRLYYYDRTAKKGKMYYYKIRAYKTIGKKTTYSAYSSVVKGKIPKK